MVIKTDFLQGLDKFSLVIKKKVTSSFTGDRRAETIGSGLIFRDYSNYVYGDDFKSIDWKTYARTEKLYVKRYEEDRNLTVHIIIDFSGSMNFGGGIKKYEYASMLALGFAYVAMKNNEKFVLAAFDDKLDFFRPSKGKAQIASMLAYLNDKKPVGVTKFFDSLIKYKQLIHSKSLVVIISDFFYDIHQIETILHRYKRNKIILIQVLDTLEKKMNIEGDYELIDLESDTNVHTFVDPFLRKRYFDDMEKHRAGIIQICNEVKADFFVVGSDEEIFDFFYKVPVSYTHLTLPTTPYV